MEINTKHPRRRNPKTEDNVAVGCGTKPLETDIEEIGEGPDGARNTRKQLQNQSIHGVELRFSTLHK